MKSSKKSSVAAFRAMIAAFLAAEAQILGPGRAWHATNVQQERLLSEVFPGMRPENDRIPEIDTSVSWSADDINAFLRERGMDIQLDPLGPDTFGFAAVMKVAVQWLQRGVAKAITGVDGIEYSGARLESAYVKGGPSLLFRRSPRHEHPIVTIRTVSSDLVHLTTFGEDVSSFDLNARVAELLPDATQIYDFEGVHFPAIDLDVQPDVSYLLEMWTELDNGKRAWLVQALQQCKLRMNHVGAVVEDAFAGAASLEGMMTPPKPDLVLNDDFLFVLERPNLTQPVFAAVLRPDVWKDPGEIVFA